MDNSGILHVDGAEILLEQPSKAESTLACKYLRNYRKLFRFGFLYKEMKILFLTNISTAFIKMTLQYVAFIYSSILFFTALAGKITGLFSSNNKMDEAAEKNQENLKSEEINDKSHSTVNSAENQTKIEKPVGDNVSPSLFM